MNEKKCLDTHSLLEIASGNPKFAEHITSDFVVTDISLAEFFAVLLKEGDEQLVQHWHDKLEKHSVQVDKRVLINAQKFRHLHGKQQISFADAVSYVYSLLNNHPFVTTEKEFEGFSNVEIIKK